MISVVIFVSACRLVEFDTYNLPCVNVFDSFLLHDMFLNLQVQFAFDGQNLRLTVNVLQTCILNRDAGRVQYSR